MSSPYPTQEDELRAKEADADTAARIEQSAFLSAFQSIPKNNATRLSELSQEIVDNFNSIMNDARQQPYARQEDLMAGLKKLFEEEINVIEARLEYTNKISPSRAT
jgi:ribosome-binding protein aMBF1 (putative translation factor)